jgi:hypothetical protein
MVFESGILLNVEEADREYNLIELDETVPSVEDSILMLLSVLPESPIVSRTLMMKEVFLFYADFLKKFSINSDPVNDAGYFAYKYGPYSFRVNISLASLALSGKIRISDFGDYLEEQRRKMKGYEELEISSGREKYRACFSTSIDFDTVFAPYAEPFKRHEIEMKKFKDELANFKWTWDQKTAGGTLLYIYSTPSFRKFIEKSELKDKFPEAYGGRVKEDYAPRNNPFFGDGQA